MHGAVLVLTEYHTCFLGPMHHSQPPLYFFSHSHPHDTSQLEFYGWPTLIQLNALRAVLAQGFQMQFTANALMSQVFNFDARRIGGKVRIFLSLSFSLVL